MLMLDSVVRQNPEQIATEVDGEVLMMNIESGNYFGLNEVGSFIWGRIANPTPVRELCTAVQAEFDVAEDRCTADTLAFLEELERCGLVQAVASAN